MTKRRARDRQARGGYASPPYDPERQLPQPPAGPAPGARAGAPVAGLEMSPPAAGGASTVQLGKLSEAAQRVAETPTPAAIAGLRGELAVSLARALEIATEAGDVDLMLKTADRLTKLLPPVSTKPGPEPAPEPPSGGDHDSDGPRAQTPAERFRIVSGQVGH